MADHVRISKTLSYWLRHRPDEAGLTLDAQGWADVDSVLEALATARLPGDFTTLQDVVEQSDKQRYEFSTDLSQIRARQGHSISVDLDLLPATPPATLYHGTVEMFLEAIMAQGLSKMRRHHVHLSPDLETARRVGQRRGRAIILEINTAAMLTEGHVFYVTENAVWLTDSVPPRFLKRL
ncbi:MAG: RNA 2'-phosphotransferase [Terricaulis sp.]